MPTGQPSPDQQWSLDLLPFQPEANLEAFDLHCDARWGDGQLSLHYSLRGPLQDLILPLTPSLRPQRRDKLWQSTCFEAFLAEAGKPSYWELNLSPQGDWNVYHLSAYRSGLKAECRIQQLDSQVSWTNHSPSQGHCTLLVNVNFADLIAADALIELSATAVLEHRRSGCSYWAWQHCGPEADFHRRDSLMPPPWISGN